LDWVCYELFGYVNDINEILLVKDILLV